jgi:hypothetical protein
MNFLEAAAMQSVLAKAKNTKLILDPFPHLVIHDALENSLYERLMSEFPASSVVNVQNRALINNDYTYLGAVEVAKSSIISAEFKEFFRYHTSYDFLKEALELVGDEAVRLHPSLGPILSGVRKEHVVVADSGATGAFHMQCQFGINSPVIHESSVRSAHLDRPNKIYNALLYCRADEDDSHGGDLILYRFDKQPGFYGNRTALPGRIKEVAVVPYRKNTLVLLVNSAGSVHGVSPRKPTSHIRRYINFQVELERPNFNIPTVNPVSAWFERKFAI